MGLGEGFHDAVPDPSRPPADKAVIAGRVRPKALWQIAPRCAGAQYPENAVEDTSVVDPRHASGLVRQKRPNGGPLKVREFSTFQWSSVITSCPALTASRNKIAEWLPPGDAVPTNRHSSSFQTGDRRGNASSRTGVPGQEKTAPTSERRGPWSHHVQLEVRGSQLNAPGGGAFSTQENASAKAWPGSRFLHEV
jgi:hypothetical protein